MEIKLIICLFFAALFFAMLAASFAHEVTKLENEVRRKDREIKALNRALYRDQFDVPEV